VVTQERQETIAAGGAVGGDRRGRIGVALVLLASGLMLFAMRVLESTPPQGVFDLDQAWKVSLAERFERGEIAGRDFFYTYGPATQVVTWLAMRMHRTRDALASAPLADLLFVAINLALLGVLLWQFELGPAGAALAVAILAAARVPEHYASCRVLLVVLAAFAVAAAMAADGARRRILLSAAAGAVALLSQLVSADLFVLATLAIAATVGVWLAVALWQEGRLGLPWSGTMRELRPAVVTVTLVSAFTVAAGNLAIATFCAPGAGWLGYHRELVDMIAGYGLTMGHHWALDPGRTLALALAMALTGWRTLRYVVSASTGERAGLLALFASGVVTARSAFTRSDLGHITLGLTPWVALLAVLAGLELRRARALSAPLLGGLVLLLASWPISDVSGIARALATPLRAAQVRDRLHELRGAEVDRAEVLRRAAPRRRVASRLAGVQDALGGGGLAVIPWENHLAIALGAEPAGAILQAYAVHTLAAQARYLESLRASPEARVLLAVDHLGTRPLEGVLTAVRLPGILRGLLEELAPEAPQQLHRAPFLLLDRRPTPRRLRSTVLDVLALPGTHRAGTEHRFEWRSAPCRLLALELRLDYPPWVTLTRPEQLELEVSSGDGAVVVSRVVPLRNGEPFEILVPLISMDRFAELWATPVDRGSLVSGLSLRRMPDPMAAAPRRLELRGASCLDW
jgi:hypothetical protein